MWIKALARSLMIVVGVFAIIAGVKQLFHSVYLTVIVAGTEGSMSILLASWIPAGILIFLGSRLIYRPPNRILALIREEADESQARMIPTRVVLHTVSIFLGVILLFWAAPCLTRMIAHMLSVDTSLELAKVLNPLWRSIADFVVYAAGGIYFLLGAPHFVRWQLRKLEGLKQQTA